MDSPPTCTVCTLVFLQVGLFECATSGSGPLSQWWVCCHQPEQGCRNRGVVHEFTKMKLGFHTGDIPPSPLNDLPVLEPKWVDDHRTERLTIRLGLNHEYSVCLKTDWVELSTVSAVWTSGGALEHSQLHNELFHYLLNWLLYGEKILQTKPLVDWPIGKGFMKTFLWFTIAKPCPLLGVHLTTVGKCSNDGKQVLSWSDYIRRSWHVKESRTTIGSLCCSSHNVACNSLRMMVLL